MYCFIVFCVVLIKMFTECDSSEGKMFYSSSHLQQALVDGNNLLKQINMTQVTKNSTKEALNRFKFDFGFYTSLNKKWPDGIARHPVYIYSMVRDLYKLRKLEKTLPHTVNMDNLPTFDDLEGTAMAISRLQYTYELNIDDIADGIIAGERSTELMSEDCLVIGQQAHNESRLEEAVRWFNKALSLKSKKTKALKTKIYSKKCVCEFKLGMKDQALRSVNNWLHLDADSSEGNRMKAQIVRMKDKRIHTNGMSEKMLNYMKLCRGDPTKESRNITQLSKLKCRFHDNHRHPLLVLQPLRVEDVSSDPHMKIFRDVLSEKERKKIRELTQPKLKISKVRTNDHRSVASRSRISMGYFFDSSRPECKQLQTKLYRRVQAMTGLLSRSYEALQISNYGIGGYYYSHHDWTTRDVDPFYNERIATLLLYLNEVEAGGATVFPKVGIRVAPSVGDGVFWYNLMRNTLGKDNTFHAGCPVLLGTKWVANVWIGRHHQEFVRPCTLNKDE